MAAFCGQCGVNLPRESQFCHKCGAAISLVSEQPDASPPPRASTSTQSTFHPWNYIESGRVYRSSLIGAAIHYLCWAVGLAIAGVLLLHFVSWFICMVVFGVVLFLFDQGRRRYGVRYGACPHCAEMVSIPSHLIAINCPICTKRIFVRGQEFRAV